MQARISLPCHAMPCRIMSRRATPMSCRRSAAILSALSRFRPSSRLRRAEQSGGSVLIGGWQERASGPVFPRNFPFLPPSFPLSLPLSPLLISVFFLSSSYSLHLALSSETLSSLCLCFLSFLSPTFPHPLWTTLPSSLDFKARSLRSVLLRVDYHSLVQLPV